MKGVLKTSVVICIFVHMHVFKTPTLMQDRGFKNCDKHESLNARSFAMRDV